MGSIGLRGSNTAEHGNCTSLMFEDPSSSLSPFSGALEQATIRPSSRGP